jgi:DNA-directed RNA polymerase sigma subunit (sigma70/sigma32)
VTFSTFSRQYIAGRVQRAVRQVEFSHLTQHEFNLRKRIRAAQAILSAKLERPPTMEEIAQEAGVPLEKVNKTLSAGTASLDTPIGDGDGTLADVVAKVGTSDADRTTVDIEQHLDELSALELWVISARSDIYDGDNQSLVEVSDTIGIGREIARRAETRGKLRLHAAAWAAGSSP